ncbi:MAG: KH domain-containing protein [Candidatus Nomurabacteria bacterium]|jgi:predicted RNA-binding protein YlqC (UPF0109 family)|nr:KH domain-containing protein [Candidatus Nomurabacteria bacterium]
MATIDQQFIEYIVKQLVTEPDAVKIERKIDEKGVLLELTVSPEDIGRVIGKRGSTAQSLRNLLRALGSKNDARYNLKIVDIDKPEGERNTRSDYGDRDNSDDAPAEDEEAPREPENVEPVEENSAEDVENESGLTEKTRKELADLDDLDI